MPKATAVFDADDSRFGAALARINGRMLALQSRIAKFAGAFLAIRAAARVVTAGFDHFKQALDVGGQLNQTKGQVIYLQSSRRAVASRQSL